MGKLIMNNKEREQLIVFKRLDEKEISQAIAAEILHMSIRWVRTKFKRYKNEGDSGLVHRNRGQASSKRWNAADKAFSIELLKSDWHGFGPTFAAEKLMQKHNIKISPETLRTVMLANGIEYSKRKSGKRRRRRERRLVLGIMVQLDGSPHDWFEGRGPSCTLLVFIDDATSQILWLEFAESESLHSVMRAAMGYFKKHGRPVSFYVDYGSVFSVNTNNKERYKKSQFERAMKELSVTMIHARSPQAKGRVERCNRTMQDRLIKEMRLEGINALEAANRFVQEGSFIAEHNAKFAEEAAQPGDAHCSVDHYDLDNILCVKATRTIMNDYTISYNNRILQLIDTKPVSVRPKDIAAVHHHLDGNIHLKIRNSMLRFKEVGSRKRNKITPVEFVQIQRDIVDTIDNNEVPAERNFSCWQDANPSILNDIERAHLTTLTLKALSQ